MVRYSLVENINMWSVIIHLALNRCYFSFRFVFYDYIKYFISVTQYFYMNTGNKC